MGMLHARRLKRLERTLPEAAGRSVPSPAPEIALWLASIGFVRESNEGLADTMGGRWG
jgi:hypothetical protein